MQTAGFLNLNVPEEAADDWTVEYTIPLRRENDCVQLLGVLEAHDGEAWSVRQIAEEAMIPATTARRLLFPKVMEYRPYRWILSLRARVNSSSTRPAAEATTSMVRSLYAQMLSNLTYVGVRRGVEVVRVNTSQFELFQRIGASYDFLVTFDSTIGVSERGPRGRARARYVGPTFRWSAEDKLDAEGYLVR